FVLIGTNLNTSCAALGTKNTKFSLRKIGKTPEKTTMSSCISLNTHRWIRSAFPPFHYSAQRSNIKQNCKCVLDFLIN
uniref:Uncharacterized protein n=1 Tax=Denticeps clupeoides TaxID=299321 RepID=A0AAY4DDT6_9TELE